MSCGRLFAESISIKNGEKSTFIKEASCMTASIALLSLYDRVTGEHFSHTNRMKQLFEESAQLHFPQKSLS